MNAIPAHIAGVGEIVMVTPPGKDGKVNPAILAAAKIAGVTQIYKVGGAQAIAALAYGTQTSTSEGPAIMSMFTCPKTCFLASAT